jgi:hypothetical protein
VDYCHSRPTFIYRLPSVTVTNPPRMADFAQVLAAVEEILETGGLERYRERACPF